MKNLYLDIRNGLDEVTLLKLLSEVHPEKDILTTVSNLFVIHSKEDMKAWITNLKVKDSVKKHMLHVLEKCKEYKLRIGKKDLVLVGSIAYLLDDLKLDCFISSPVVINNTYLAENEYKKEYCILSSENTSSDLSLLLLKEFNCKTLKEYEFQMDKVIRTKNQNGKEVCAYLNREENKLIELVTNLDDMSAEYLSFAEEELYKAGAQDVYTTYIHMKKGRSGMMLTCMCFEKDRDIMLNLIFKHTTTLGVREYHAIRYGLESEKKLVHTKLGDVHEKISNGYNVTREKYEYEDLAKIARKKNLSLNEVKELIEKNTK